MPVCLRREVVAVQIDVASGVGELQHLMQRVQDESALLRGDGRAASVSRYSLIPETGP